MCWTRAGSSLFPGLKPGGLALAVAGSAALLLATLHGLDLTSGAPAGLVIVREARPLMGTVFRITVASRAVARPAVAAAVEEGFGEVARLEQVMSEWRDGTELSSVNRAAGASPVRVCAETFEVLERARHFSETSGGAFDVTFNALWGLWDFRRTPPVLPDPAEVARRLPLIDHRKLRLDAAARTAFLEQRGMRIGLGGIAKGYAVDRVCELLRRRGLADHIVAGGGDVRTAGSRGGQPWRVAIQHPREPGAMFTMEAGEGLAVSTSGDYERYFIIGGRRYHHIMDPRTGSPARGLISATVIAPTAMDSDAMATAVFVLGAPRGLDLASRTPGVEALVVDDDGRAHMTHGLRAQAAVPDEVPILRILARHGRGPPAPGDDPRPLAAGGR
jgi:thiamine biosynthesis lipoprotein